MTMMGVVGELLRTRARKHPDKLFWWVDDDRASYAEADARSDRLAAGLAEIGVRFGDRVAVLSTNRGEYLETLFALAKLGAIQVPLNAYLRGDFLQYQIHQAGAEVAVADAPGVKALGMVLNRVPALKRIVTFDDGTEAPAGIDIVPFAQVRNCDHAAPRPAITPSDLVSIMYTSGTTGMPKGCMLPHGYYVHHGAVNLGQLEVRDDDVMFTALPLFHGGGHMGMVMSALYNGISLVVEPAFHATSTVDRWIETGATLFFGAGMVGMAMLQLPPSQTDRAHGVRGGLLQGLPPPQQEQFHHRFGVEISAERYGQTECSPTALSPFGTRRAGSAGKPAPHYDVAIVDREDNFVTPGEVGEIVVRPKVPNTMYAGYWRQPEATVSAWRNLWHHTGDYGRLDTEGFLYFVDRKKDALRRRGESISSVEVETAVLKDPSIAEAAVVAVPSELTEDEVMACLVLAPGERMEPRELFEFLQTSLPYFAVPRFVRIMRDLPKTPTMKVQKHLLRQQGVTADAWDFAAMGFQIERADRR